MREGRVSKDGPLSSVNVQRYLKQLLYCGGVLLTWSGSSPARLNTDKAGAGFVIV